MVFYHPQNKLNGICIVTAFGKLNAKNRIIHRSHFAVSLTSIFYQSTQKKERASTCGLVTHTRRHRIGCKRRFSELSYSSVMLCLYHHKCVSSWRPSFREETVKPFMSAWRITSTSTKLRGTLSAQGWFYGGDLYIYDLYTYYFIVFAFVLLGVNRVIHVKT